MRFGVCFPNFGSYADPHLMMELAAAVEASGWDGLFVWDHHAYVWGPPTGDPWIILSACATVTSRIVLGTSVTPLPRRRVQDVALEASTLDHLAGGRFVFGAGLGGATEELAAFGEVVEERVRAEMLDEGLELLNQLWRGETVRHGGKHYPVDGVMLSPLPPRQSLPVWIGGNSRPALRRAARWNGWIAASVSETSMTMKPDDIASALQEIRRHRQTSDPFDVVVNGYSEPADLSTPKAYADAGATWWLENLHDLRGDVGSMRARIADGPPGT